MTTTATYLPAYLAGNGVTVSFPFSFRVFASSELSVVLVDSYGNQVALTEGTDYTVTGAGSYSGGAAVLTVAPATGWHVLLSRVTDIEQAISFRGQGAFFPEIHEDALDKLTHIALEQREKLDRAFAAPEAGGPYDLDLPVPSPGYALGWDDTGTKLVNVPNTGADQDADLASTSDYAKGAGKVGFMASLAYAAGTVGKALSDIVSSYGASLIGYLAPFAGSLSTTQDAVNARTVYVEDFGAVGDGTTDDTAAIQTALDSGASLIRLAQGKTYLVSCAGVLTTPYENTYYALKVPSNTTLDLGESTIYLDDDSNCVILINANAGNGVEDQSITITNGTLDMNQANQDDPTTGEAAAMWMHYITGLKVTKIRVLNPLEYAGRFLSIDKGYFDDLYAYGGYGDGWSFGITGIDGGARPDDRRVSNSFIDHVYAENFLSGHGTQQGNGAIFTIKNCNVGSVETYNCGGGTKVQDASEYSNISNILFVGGANGTDNSGFKIQGNNGGSLIPVGITVGNVVCRDTGSYGLYVNECQRCRISSYIGENNGATLIPDVAIVNANIVIGSVISNGCADSGVYVGDSGTPVVYNNSYIGHVEVNQCTGSAVTVNTDNSACFGDIVANDARGAGALMTDCFKVTSTLATGSVASIKTSMSVSTTQPWISIVSGNFAYTIGKFEADSGAYEASPAGWVELTNGATSTSVACTSVFMMYIGESPTGSYNHLSPVIILTPTSSGGASRYSGARVVPNDITAGTGFVIYHSTAGSTDRMAWKVDHWRVLNKGQS